jgi:dCMP deaminase
LSYIYNFSRGKISQIDNRETPKDSFWDSISNFLSQDIATCIQIADIYIKNTGKHDNINYNNLKEQLVRYVSLIQHPGIINPSKNEKLMQMAFTAKLNSGCLSRKVGAIVTNSAGSPKAIGWNSSPEGQTSCLLRNVHAMINNTDPYSYSQYEKTNTDMISIAREYIQSFDVALEERGLNCSFCFKDFQNKKERKGNQVHNRALHAEENAFLQVAKFGGEGVAGGSLYTTAAPCDLCSRKAYQLGIRKIFYIDPYPGIAVEHVLMVGREPPELILFHGAIGSAYHKLYSSIIPYKDELYSYLETDLFRKLKHIDSFSLP